jgi:hypothetical protein
MNSPRNVSLVPFVLLTHIYNDDVLVVTSNLMLLSQGILHL